MEGAEAYHAEDVRRCSHIFYDHITLLDTPHPAAPDPSRRAFLRLYYILPKAESIPNAKCLSRNAPGTILAIFRNPNASSALSNSANVPQIHNQSSYHLRLPSFSSSSLNAASISLPQSLLNPSILPSTLCTVFLHIPPKTPGKWRLMPSNALSCASIFRLLSLDSSSTVPSAPSNSKPLSSILHLAHLSGISSSRRRFGALFSSQAWITCPQVL